MHHRLDCIIIFILDELINHLLAELDGIFLGLASALRNTLLHLFLDLFSAQI